MRKSGLTGDEAYMLSKRGKTTEDLGPLKKEISLIKEDLSNKITKFYASNQGETHLADSDNGKIMDMMLYGKSSQFTTTGKNLANGQNINCFINSVADTCGISSNDNGMVIDASKLTNVSISTRSIQDRYRFACANTVPTKGNPITCYNGTSKDGTKDSYTMDTTGYNYLFINATKLEDIQVEKGSVSTSYEPYTGGIPSPSPDYPQEIKSVVNPTVKLSNEDGTQSETVTLPYTLNAIPVSSDGNVTINGQQYVADYVDVERGKLVRMCKKIDFAKVTPDFYINKLVVSREARYDYVKNNLKKVASSATVKTGSGYITAVNLLLSTWNRDIVGIGAHSQGEGQYLALRVPSDTGAIEYFSSIGGCKGIFQIEVPEEIDLTPEQVQAYKFLFTNYPITNIEVSSEQLDGYTIFNYPISMAEGWNYVKQQIGDTRDYIYDMDLQSAEAYVNSEYAVALTELEV